MRTARLHRTTSLRRRYRYSITSTSFNSSIRTSAIPLFSIRFATQHGLSLSGPFVCFFCSVFDFFKIFTMIFCFFFQIILNLPWIWLVIDVSFHGTLVDVLCLPDDNWQRSRQLNKTNIPNIYLYIYIYTCIHMYIYMHIYIFILHKKKCKQIRLRNKWRFLGLRRTGYINPEIWRWVHLLHGSIRPASSFLGSAAAFPPCMDLCQFTANGIDGHCSP